MSVVQNEKARRWLRVAVMIGGAALAAACTDGSDLGGLTADVVFRDHPGISRQALRAAAVPASVGKLQISALDASGATIAVTILSLQPGEGEQLLMPAGGDWTLDGVPAGPNRSILGEAFLAPGIAPGLDGVLAFEGRIDGIDVAPGEVKEAGLLELFPGPMRIPEVDFDPPSPPNPVTALPLPEGEAVRVTFTPPPEPDATGYLVAVASSTAARQPPLLDRGTSVREGGQLAPGVIVHTIGTFTQIDIVTVEQLVDNVSVGILVYAFDVDRNQQPLNFSPPGLSLTQPTDTLAPGAPLNLSAQTIGQDRVRISFTGPGEDAAGGGAPLAYQVRAAQDALPLADPDAFEALPLVQAPPVAPPGDTVSFERTLTQLGATPNTRFFVGVRALDASANEGPAAVVEVILNATVAPSLAAIAPPIGLAGRELVLTGVGFGTQTGTVTLAATETATTTVTLAVSRWTDTEIIAGLPANSRTGLLRITRPDGPFTEAPLSVLASIPNQVQDEEYPFDLVGTGLSDGRSIAALYREDGEFSNLEAGIERFYDAVNEGVVWAPQNTNQRSTAVAGTYSPAHDRFLFVAADQTLSMTTALITSSTVTPDPFRLPVGVTAGLPDRVSVIIPDGGVAGAVPAMVAFTINGAIRTATVTDARFQPFDGFIVDTSTAADYEQVTLARLSDGAVLMAHRTVTGTVAVLSLRDNPGGQAPDAFVPRAVAAPPRMGTNVEVIAAPAVPGGPDRFLIAYEYLNAAEETEVRILFADDFGQTTGYDPFGPGPSRRLDDIGLVIRQGQVYLAVASSKVNGSAEFTYTEVPIAAIDDPTTPRGRWPGVVVDIAPDDFVARIGCKPFAQRACPMVWLGDSDGVLFYRR